VATRGRRRLYETLAAPPLSPELVSRLVTTAAVKAAVEHFWGTRPSGGNLAYWRRRLMNG
jgi:hypothetical protein